MGSSEFSADNVNPAEPADAGGSETAFESALEPVLGEGAGAYAVKLSVFEGPLDLLLHLIRQNEVEITDIPVAVISQQYLDYLGLMRELNLDVAGEYLVMAASLALIKSRMLLPPDGSEEDDDAVTDPRAELVARLLEYKRYKEAAEELSKRRLLGRDVFLAQGSEPEPIPDSEREVAVDLFQLLAAFRDVLARAEDQGPGVHEVDHEPVTVRERMIAVMVRLEQVDSIEFHRIFDDDEGGAPTRPILVATFLAILELTRLSALRIYQGIAETGAPTGPIRLRRTPPESLEDGDLSWSERISEFM